MMAGIEEALERLDRDPSFRRELRRDPASALSRYVLFDEDLATLADRLDAIDGDRAPRGQRRENSADATLEWLILALTESVGLPDDEGERT